MLIFRNSVTNKEMVFIHIPKNSGKFIRNKIKNDKNNTIIKEFWGIVKNMDIAHIPYLRRNNHIEEGTQYTYFAHSRNPYHRIISAFFYLNKGKNVIDFKNFCKHVLPKLDFNLNFVKEYIHYYPQYLFVCEANLEMTDVIITKIEDSESPKIYNLKETLDKKCVQVINKVYEKDFKYFNYAMIST